MEHVIRLSRKTELCPMRQYIAVKPYEPLLSKSGRDTVPSEGPELHDSVLLIFREENIS